MVARFRQLTMPYAPDMDDPELEVVAHQLHTLTPRSRVPGMAGRPSSFWEKDDPEVRAIYRARARRFMAGDLSMAPWAIG